jgi:hypothetical protein
MRRLVADANLRRSLGDDGRSFAAARHDPRAIARAILGDYIG